jgi:prepilin-type N-terminal cleavage/methylation domain-containing protein
VFSPQARGVARAEANADEGFSVIEVMVAIGVFAIVAIFMSQTLASGLRGVLGGKRREVATQEANKTLEIARSLSYDAIGLVQADATIPTDSAITTQAGKLSYRSASTWEPLIWANNPAGHPFNPHLTAISRGSTQLSRYVYVTGVDSNSDGTIDLKRVLVRVAWDTDSSTGAINEVRAQTLIHKDAGVTCPGCGNVPLTSTAFATGGTLSVNSSLLGLTAPLALTLPNTTGNSTFRAVSDVNCTGTSTGINVLDVVSLPGESVSVSADDDSRTAKASAPAAQTKTGALSIPLGPVRNILGSVINSPVSCEADVNALGHELGTGSSLGTLNATSNVTALAGALNWVMTLASVQTLPVSQQIDHEVVASQREAHSQAAVSTGLVNVLKLPAAGITDGLVRVDAVSYGASVRGAGGTPSAAPTITAPTIAMRIYDNGNKLSGCSSRSGGYCVISVNPSAGAFVGVNFSVTHNFTQLLGINVINLSYTTNVSILPPAKSALAGVTGANGEKRWEAEYSPLTISANLSANILGVPLINATVDLNLGTAQAKACAGVTCP